MVDEGFGASYPIHATPEDADQGRQIPPGADRRGAAAHLPPVRLDQNALPGHDRRRGHQVLSGQLLLRPKSPPGRKRSAAPSIPNTSITRSASSRFLKLREDYRQQEGADFSLQKFHDEMLRHGAPPIRLLRELMLKDPASWDQIL